MTTDIAETIARVRRDFHTISYDDLAAVLDAAEAGIAADKVIAETNDRAREAAEELAKFRAEQARDAALEEAAVFADLWGYGWVAECIRDAKTGPWHLPKEEHARRALEAK